MRHHKKASGGGMKSEAQSGPHQEETNMKTSESMEHEDEYKGKNPAEREVTVEKKKGGRVKRARGGHVSDHKHTKGGRAVMGKPPGMRLDKKARGGSPKNPLSGADTTPLPYMHGNLSGDDGAKGKKVKAS